MRRTERGASYIPVIIVIVLLIVAVVWAYIETDNVNHLRVQLKSAQTRAATFNTDNSNLKLKLQSVEQEVGWPLPSTSTEAAEYFIDSGAVGKSKQQWLNDLETKMIGNYPVDSYTFVKDGGVKVSQTGDMVKVRYVEAPTIASDTTIQQLYTYMNGAMVRMLADINRLVKQVGEDSNTLSARKDALQKTIDAKDTTITQLRTQLSQLQEAKAASERNLNNQINDLRSKSRAAQAALDSARQSARQVKTELTNENLALKQDVQDLKSRQRVNRHPTGPDGRVLSVTDSDDLVVINRGKSDHLMPGTTFQVYDYGKGAEKQMKAMIKVLDVTSKTATARVIHLDDSLNPIVTGDYIESLTYNPKEVLHFYLLGRFSKYGRSDAASRLRSLGDEVDSSVGISTSFLVLGAPENKDQDLRDTDAYKRAKELGIPILTEDELSRFLNY